MLRSVTTRPHRRLPSLCIRLGYYGFGSGGQAVVVTRLGLRAASANCMNHFSRVSSSFTDIRSAMIVSSGMVIWCIICMGVERVVDDLN
jgi:hypothetical protein